MRDPWGELIELVREGAEVGERWGEEVREDGTTEGGTFGDYPFRREVWIRRRVPAGVWGVTVGLVNSWARERSMEVRVRKGTRAEGGWLILHGVCWKPG